MMGSGEDADAAVDKAGREGEREEGGRKEEEEEEEDRRRPKRPRTRRMLFLPTSRLVCSFCGVCWTDECMLSREKGRKGGRASFMKEQINRHQSIAQFLPILEKPRRHPTPHTERRTITLPAPSSTSSTSSLAIGKYRCLSTLLMPPLLRLLLFRDPSELLPPSLVAAWSTPLPAWVQQTTRLIDTAVAVGRGKKEMKGKGECIFTVVEFGGKRSEGGGGWKGEWTGCMAKRDKCNGRRKYVTSVVYVPAC